VTDRKPIEDLADSAHAMPDRTDGYTQQGLERLVPARPRGRPRRAAAERRDLNWGYLDRYADGYEDGEFARYQQSRDAETPLGFARRKGEAPRNDTARRR
jgi:hypothetical protein